MLEPHRSALEKCVYCPKLCRSACPVSNAEPRETLTPWGKMSLTAFVAQGDVELAPSFAQPAWACTGCHACRESCDHRNDVPTTLFAARDALSLAGVAPPPAAKALAGFARHAAATRHAVRELSAHPAARQEAPVALLLGCAYARALPKESRDAIGVALALTSGPVSLVEACCGLPLLHAGDAAGFARQGRILAEETARKEVLLVVDAGCAEALRTRFPQHAVTLSPRVELLVDRAAGALERMGTLPGSTEPVRYHDSCQLGRGLGVYDPPRSVLTRILGRAPDEFESHREKAGCSGAGGLLPRTMPENARAIGALRVAEHERQGGGRIVTSCASSLLAFRRRGAKADDLVTWMARALPRYRP